MSTDRKFPEPQAFEEGDAPSIPMQPVDSSQVNAVGYDEASKTLAVQFKHGAQAIYCYPNVEPKLYRDFIGAESMGKFHGQHIKVLPFKKYRAPQKKTEAA